MTKTSAKPKVDLQRIMEQDKKIMSAPAPAEDQKPAAIMGRPKIKPPSKQAPYHLPIDLIARIEEAAGLFFGGNKSALATKALEAYLDTLKDRQPL